MPDNPTTQELYPPPEDVRQDVLFHAEPLEERLSGLKAALEVAITDTANDLANLSELVDHYQARHKACEASLKRLNAAFDALTTQPPPPKPTSHIVPNRGYSGREMSVYDSVLAALTKEPQTSQEIATRAKVHYTAASKVLNILLRENKVKFRQATSPNGTTIKNSLVKLWTLR